MGSEFVVQKSRCLQELKTIKMPEPQKNLKFARFQNTRKPSGFEFRWAFHHHAFWSKVTDQPCYHAIAWKLKHKKFLQSATCSWKPKLWIRRTTLDYLVGVLELHTSTWPYVIYNLYSVVRKNAYCLLAVPSCYFYPCL